MIASPRGPRCLAAEAVALEIARHVPRLAAKRGLNSALMFGALGAVPVDWKASGEYEDRREQAEASGDPDDWPTVALALKLSLPVWSQDKDLADAGHRGVYDRCAARCAG